MRIYTFKTGFSKESIKFDISISALNKLHLLGFCVCVYEHLVFDFQPNFEAENANFLGRGVLLGILGGNVPPGSLNPDLISDQNMSFHTRF